MSDDAPWLTISTRTDLTAPGPAGDGRPRRRRRRGPVGGAPSSSACFDAARPATECIQRGALYVVKARASWPKTELDVHADADLAIEGPAAYDFFGQAMAVAEIGGARSVLVGAPGHRNRNGSTAGAVYVFALHNSGGVLSASLALTIEGEEPLAELGHALAVGGGTLLALASPAAGASGESLRGGEVRLIPIANVSTANRTVGLSALSATATLRGTAAAGLRLGRPRPRARVGGRRARRRRAACHDGDAREAAPPRLAGGVTADRRRRRRRSERGVERARQRTRGRLGAALAAAGRGRLGVGAAGGRRRERDGGRGGGLREREYG